MSGKDKRGSNSAPKGAHAKPPPGVAATFSARMNKIFNDLEGLRKDRDGLQEYGSLSDELAACREELLRKDEELEEKQKEFDELVREKDATIKNFRKDLDEREIGGQELVRTFENRYTEWQTQQERHDKDSEELAKLREENAKLKQIVDENDRLLEELDDVKEKLRELGKKNKALGLDIRQKKLDLETMANKLTDSTHALDQANDAIGFLPWDEKEAYVKSLYFSHQQSGMHSYPTSFSCREQAFDSLSSRLHQVVREHFYTEVANPGVSLNIQCELEGGNGVLC